MLLSNLKSQIVLCLLLAFCFLPSAKAQNASFGTPLSWHDYNPATPTLSMQSGPNQTANLLTLKNSSGTTVTTVDVNGVLNAGGGVLTGITTFTTLKSASGGVATAGNIRLSEGDSIQSSDSTGLLNLVLLSVTPANNLQIDPPIQLTHVITTPVTWTGSLLWGDNIDNNIDFYPNGSPTIQHLPSVTMLASAYTNATTTFSNTGLSYAVAGTRQYTMTCQIVWQGSATTTGPKYQFTGPASPTTVAAGAVSAVTSSTFLNLTAVAFGSAMANNGTITATTNFVDKVTLGLVNGSTSGAVNLQAAANGAGTLTIQPGSYCVLQ